MADLHLNLGKELPKSDMAVGIRRNLFWQLLKKTGSRWYKANAPRLGAALSYYTVFSLAPLLIVAVSIAGLVFGKEAVHGELSLQMTGLIGKQGAQAVESLIASASRPFSGVLATIIGVITLLLGGTAVFSELRAILNEIWSVPPSKVSGFWALIKDKLLSFAMMGSVGFLLLVSLIANTFLAMTTKFFASSLPMPGVLGHFLYSFTSFALISFLFALIFKVLPEKDITWKEVWVGALITSLFFSMGKFLIGLYLGRATVTSSFGASGSLVIIMLWAYYSSLIVIFGAEFTRVYSERHSIVNGA